jgi:PAS domain S-box-containing protein
VKQGNVKGDSQKEGLLYRFHYYFWILGFLWTGCIIASLLWNIHERKEKIFQIAHNNANLILEKDLSYRKWAAKQGGIYVPVSPHLPPNPYLRVPNRDLALSSGLVLTLVNPAYMTRQVNQMSADINSGLSHLTSLNPVRPENSPDPWEKRALTFFERGTKEINSVERMAGKEYMRLMRPFPVEKDCLKCHARQGYKEGDIRGGISASVPMGPLWAIEKPYIIDISIAHFSLWIIGLTGIGMLKKRLDRQMLARETAEKDLIESEERFSKAFQVSQAAMCISRLADGCFLDVNESFLKLSGYSREEVIGRTSTDLKMFNDPDQQARIVSVLDKQGKLQNFILNGRTKTGEHIQTLFSSQRITLNSQDCAISTLIDITESAKFEEALQRHALELQLLTETLEDRVRERTTELADLSTRLVSAQENERKRISYDLHDNVWQTLVAIKFEIEGLFSGREADRAALDRKSGDIMADIQGTVEKIRSMQGDLWPYVLDDIGLLATINWYCREFEKGHAGLAIEKLHDIFETEIPAGVKIVIYRILQEALSNVAKHSQADQVKLRLTKKDQGMEFSVEDNGVGFDPERTIARRVPWGGLGLLGIKARIELSGGIFVIESAEGQGTIVRASWPIGRSG